MDSQRPGCQGGTICKGAGLSGIEYRMSYHVEVYSGILRGNADPEVRCGDLYFNGLWKGA